MPYRPASVVQSDIARVIRAFRDAGFENVQVRLTATGPVISPSVYDPSQPLDLPPPTHDDHEEVIVVPPCPARNRST